MPADRIETGTFIAAAAMTGSQIQLNHVLPDELDAVLDRFEATGCRFEIKTSERSHTGKALLVEGPPELMPVDIRTAPFPGYPTDMQAQMMACMCLAKGRLSFMKLFSKIALCMSWNWTGWAHAFVSMEIRQL